MPSRRSDVENVSKPVAQQNAFQRLMFSALARKGLHSQNAGALVKAPRSVADTGCPHYELRWLDVTAKGDPTPTYLRRLVPVAHSHICVHASTLGGPGSDFALRVRGIPTQSGAPTAGLLGSVRVLEPQRCEERLSRAPMLMDHKLMKEVLEQKQQCSRKAPAGWTKCRQHKLGKRSKGRLVELTEAEREARFPALLELHRSHSR
jgi:hypothetical protein